MLLKKKGIIFVISAPSGTGKTTVCKKLKKSVFDISYSISTTSRNPRKGEIEGKDYFFISKENFEKKIKNDEFVEWTKILDNYYGTERKNLQSFREDKKDTILNIDVKGGMSIKKIYEDSVLIFLMPPSFEELKKRLKNRGSETKQALKRRLSLAKKEIEKTGYYDYIVINKEIQNTIDEIRSIIVAERRRVFRVDISKIIDNLDI